VGQCTDADYDLNQINRLITDWSIRSR